MSGWELRRTQWQRRVIDGERRHRIEFGRAHRRIDLPTKISRRSSQELPRSYRRAAEKNVLDGRGDPLGPTIKSAASEAPEASTSSTPQSHLNRAGSGGFPGRGVRGVLKFPSGRSAPC